MEMPISNPNLPANHQDIDDIPTDPLDGQNYPGRMIKTNFLHNGLPTYRPAVSLVTGGAGFIGSHVAENLLAMGHKVVVVDDLSGGFRRNVPDGAEFYCVSVSEQQHKLEALFEQYKFDYVFHLAAYAAEGLSHFIRGFNYKNNLIGSTNLINLAVKHKVKRFVFTSSIAVYGEGRTPMTEDMVPMPEDPYGISKYAVEMDLHAAYKMWGLEYTIFRPHNVYGARQHHGDPYRNALGIFVNQLFAHKPITIFGDGLQTRAFSYIEDVAPYIAKSCSMPECVNQIINVGSDYPRTVREIAQIIREMLNPDAEIVFLPERNEVKHAYCDHSKFKEIFKIDHETEILEGVSNMVEYAKQVGYMEPNKFSGIEVWDKMPESWRKFTE